MASAGPSYWFGWFCWSVLVVSMLPWLAQWYRVFTAWMATQPEWMQGFVVGAVLLLLPAWGAAGFSGLKWCVRRVRAHVLARKQASALKQAEFQSFPAELGEVDHGVNALAMPEVITLVKQVADPVKRIKDTLLSSPFDRLSPNDSQYAQKKQEIHRRIANSLQDEALLLERLAPQIEERADLFVAGNRAILTQDIQPESVEGLRKWDKQYLLVTAGFRGIAEFLRQRSADFRKFEGKQQHLTRVMRRSTAAMDQIAATLDELCDYCSGEMRSVIAAKIKPFEAR